MSNHKRYEHSRVDGKKEYSHDLMRVCGTGITEDKKGMSVFSDVDLSNAEEIEQLVKVVFSSNEKRYRHVLSVASRVRESAEQINSHRSDGIVDVDEAYRAALLHDIGYAPELNELDFHPLDGARFLESRGYPRLAELILGHSNSPEQAHLRGIEGVRASDDLIANLITFWDVQIKQGGEQVSYDERIADIVQRYGEGSPVTVAHRLSEARIRKILDQIAGLLPDSYVKENLSWISR